MSLRNRSYTEEDERKANREYSYRGMITDWKYLIKGVSAGQLIRDGRAKLSKMPNGRVYLSIKDKGLGAEFKSYKVKAGLAKGVRSKFWEQDGA